MRFSSSLAEGGYDNQNDLPVLVDAKKSEDVIYVLKTRLQKVEVLIDKGRKMNMIRISGNWIISKPTIQYLRVMIARKIKTGK